MPFTRPGCAVTPSAAPSPSVSLGGAIHDAPLRRSLITCEITEAERSRRSAGYGTRAAHATVRVMLGWGFGVRLGG